MVHKWLRRGLSMGILLVWLVTAAPAASQNAEVGRPVPVDPADLVSSYADPLMSKEIIINQVDNETYLPSVAYNNIRGEYLVVWHTKWVLGTRDIRAQRISSKGELIGSEFTVYEHATKDSAQPSVAYDPWNDRYLVTFIFDAAGNGSDWDIYGRLIPWNGPSASYPVFPIITWSTSQWNPKVVYAGTQQEFFVVWTNTYTGGSPPAYVSGKRIYPDGTFPSGGSDLTLSDATYNYIDPDVSYNIARNEYLVVWTEKKGSDDIWGLRLAGNAAQLGGGPFGIAAWPDDELKPSVAACSAVNKYLVVWQSESGSGGSDYAIYGYFITGLGGLEHVFQVDNTTSPEEEPSVACNKLGNLFLVAYQQRWVNLHYGITARVVFPNHSMEPAFVVVPPGTSTDRLNPALAGGRMQYLVAWEHERAAFQDIHGRLVTPFASFLPTIFR